MINFILGKVICICLQQLKISIGLYKLNTRKHYICHDSGDQFYLTNLLSCIFISD